MGKEAKCGGTSLLLLLLLQCARVKAAPTPTLEPTAPPTAVEQHAAQMDPQMLAAILAGAVAGVLALICVLFWLIRKHCTGTLPAGGRIVEHKIAQVVEEVGAEMFASSRAKGKGLYEVVRKEDRENSENSVPNSLNSDLSIDLEADDDKDTSFDAQTPTLTLTKRALALHNNRESFPAPPLLSRTALTGTAPPTGTGSVGNLATTGGRAAPIVWESHYSEKYKKQGFRNCSTGHVTFTRPTNGTILEPSTRKINP